MNMFYVYFLFIWISIAITIIIHSVLDAIDEIEISNIHPYTAVKMPDYKIENKEDWLK